MKIKNLKLKIIFAVISLLIINTSLVSAHGEVNNGASSSAKIDYTLAYPGLLPDSPLYFSKAAKEKIISFCIMRSIKCAFKIILSF